MFNVFREKSFNYQIYFNQHAGDTLKSGGDAKSYFVKIGDVPAYKLEKKNYEKEFGKLWSTCAKLKDSKEKKWSNLTKHIIEYTECAQ